MEKNNNYKASVTAGIMDTSTTNHLRSGDQRLMMDYMLNDDPINNNNNSMIDPSYQQQQQQQQQRQDQLDSNSNSNNLYSVDRTLSFADVMQFAEHHHNHESAIGNDQLLRFPVLGDQLLMQLPSVHDKIDHENNSGGIMVGQEGGSDFGYVQSNQDHYADNNHVQLEFMGNPSDDNFIDNLSRDDEIVVVEGGQVGGGGGGGGCGGGGGGATDGKSSGGGGSSKRKRPRTIKTSEEVESQRMTHIAVERNRRKQMNEHLRVLRSLMPSSYVQRGDQASIIGGAIEFVRELEQLLQCLESQKRRRLYGDQPSSNNNNNNNLGLVQQPPQSPLGLFQCPPPPLLPTNQHHHNDQQVQLRLVDDHNPQMDSSTNNNLDCSTTSSTAVEVGVGGSPGLLLQEEMAECKSCIADVEVKVLGFDALIKILSRRRPSQLIKAIAALEDLHFTILHTNITTIEQTVLYSFNVKVGSEARFTAEDIATSVQQIFTFIHANTNIS